jgi:serine protease inhibitor
MILLNTKNNNLENFLAKQLLLITSPIAIKYIMAICYFISSEEKKNEIEDKFLIYTESYDSLIKFKKNNNYINNEYHFYKSIELLEKTGIYKLSCDNIIYNYVNFNGKLKKNFTYYESSFKKLNNEYINLEMMKCNDVFPYYENELFQITKLELDDNINSLYILLPKNKRYYYDINGMINISNIKFIQQEMMLSIPKLKINKLNSLKDILRDLGIIKLFDFISDIHHQINFEIINNNITSNKFKCLTTAVEFNTNTTFDYYIVNEKNKMIILYGTFN